MESSNARPRVPDVVIDRVLAAVRENLQGRMAKKGRGSFVSSHEIYGILAEELNKELLDEVHANNPNQIQKELIDIAVGSIFALASYEVGGVKS